MAIDIDDLLCYSRAVYTCVDRGLRSIFRDNFTLCETKSIGREYGRSKTDYEHCGIAADAAAFIGPNTLLDCPPSLWVVFTRVASLAIEYLSYTVSTTELQDLIFRETCGVPLHHRANDGFEV